MMSERIILDKEIAPKSGFAFEVNKGQYFRIIDVKGKQVGDLVFFNRHNLREMLSISWTRTRNVKHPGTYSPSWGITTGDKIWSTGMRLMATVTQDTPVPGGVHDIFGRMCNTALYKMHNIDSRDGCWEILSKALAKWGIKPEEIPDAISVFMNTIPDPVTKTMRIEEPVTRPGDYFELRAEMDLLAGLSVCPLDVICPCNGWVITPLRIQIFEKVP